eukprot:scaffold1924_cov218-Amphora_coffeaeformis.AAC.1
MSQKRLARIERTLCFFLDFLGKLAADAVGSVAFQQDEGIKSSYIDFIDKEQTCEQNDVVEKTCLANYCANTLCKKTARRNDYSKGRDPAILPSSVYLIGNNYPSVLPPLVVCMPSIGDVSVYGTVARYCR